MSQILSLDLKTGRFEQRVIQFGIIRFSSVNDTKASVFGYLVFTRFIRPLLNITGD